MCFCLHVCMSVIIFLYVKKQQNKLKCIKYILWRLIDMHALLPRFLIPMFNSGARALKVDVGVQSEFLKSMTQFSNQYWS